MRGCKSSPIFDTTILGTATPIHRGNPQPTIQSRREKRGLEELQNGERAQLREKSYHCPDQSIGGAVDLLGIVKEFVHKGGEDFLPGSLNIEESKH